MGFKFTKKEDFNKANQDLVDLVLSENFEINYNIKEWMEDRGLNASQVAAATGLTLRTIRNYRENKTKNSTINLSHMFAFMILFRLTDINALYTIKIPVDTQERYKQEAIKWSHEGVMPQEIADRIEKNKDSVQ